MKKYSFAIILALFAATGHTQNLDRSVRPKPGPAPKIELGKTESFTLPNGMRVFVVENHKVPLISVSLQLDIRPELQGNMAGYHDLVGELLTSGTKTRTKDALDLAIDNIGASIKADEESMAGNSLRRNQSVLLELMSDIAINSDFKQTELEKLRKQTLSGLAAAKNNPDAMLENVTRSVNFGNNHPRGEVATEATVNSITLDRCKKYFSTYWRPNVAYMAIVGDVTLAEIKPLIEKYFGRWQKADVPVTSYTVPTSGGVTRVALAGRDAAVQSVFNITHTIDLAPGTPDVIKAKVANSVLGGGSQGRLFLNLRETHGWTYGSYSTIREDELLGSFTAYAKCRNIVTDSAIRETLSEMRKMQSDLVSKEDLASRITYLTGNFAIGLESPQTVAQYSINIERYKMPKDYYANYLRNLSAVTPEDVRDMARKYIHPEAANIVVVGNAEEVVRKLGQFGSVQMYDNYGQHAVPIARESAPAGTTMEEVRRKYVNAVGGEKAINAVTSLRMVYSATVQGNVQITLNEWKKGGNLKREVNVMGNVVQKNLFVNGKGTMITQGTPRDMTAQELAEAKQQADLQAVLHPEKFGISRKLVGISHEATGDVYEVDTRESDDSPGKEYYDVASGLLVRQTRSKNTPQGDIPVVVEFSDYREVPGAYGFKIPYLIKQANGAQEFEAKLETVELNKGISDSDFK